MATRLAPSTPLRYPSVIFVRTQPPNQFLTFSTTYSITACVALEKQKGWNITSSSGEINAETLAPRSRGWR